MSPIRRGLAIVGLTLAALSVPSVARAEEFVNMIQAESAARKSVRELNEREKRLQEGRDATDKHNDQYARWLASCERQERIIDQDRARHWLAYGQRWSEEETAKRKRKAITGSGCRPLK